MAAYKDLVGQKITKVTSNPGEPKTGQMRYNSTDGRLSGLGVIEGFTSSSNLIANTYAAGGAGASQTDGIIFGGQNPGGRIGTTNEYNGTGFAAGGNLGTARDNLGGCGTVPAGLGFGGRSGPSTYVGDTEEYNGTSWSEQNNLNTSRGDGGGAGTQTAGLFVAGFSSPPSTKHNQVEQYNGTSWSETGSDYPINTYAVEGAGTQTAALMAGNFGPPYTSAPYAPGLTTEYDGTNFSTAATMGTATYNGGMFGTQTSAIYGGGVLGNTNPHAAGQKYDGTTWTAVGSLIANRNALAAFGADQTAGLMGGGVPVTSATQEYNQTTNTITAAAWASGPSLNTGGRNGSAGGGIQTAAIMAGGGLPTPSVINNAEQYNGSSWSNIPTIGTARGYMAAATNASYTAALIFGGSTGPGGPFRNETEEYDGSSWSEQTNLSTARNYLAGFGTQTAGVAAGGAGTVPSPPNRLTAVEEYNGSSWTSGTSFPTGAFAWGGCGTETTGLVVGDVPGKAGTYNGSSWTTISYLNSQGNYNKVVGTSASAVQAGRNPPSNNQVEEWNGTTWFTQAQLASARFNGTNAGTSSSSLLAGPATATEEFTGETSAVNIADFTTS